MQAIYEASMGVPAEDYFGFVGDMGRLPDSTAELIDGTGLGSSWSGPYLSLGGNMRVQDVYGSDYVIDQETIRVRSFGQNRADDSGAGDDIVYPESALNTYKGLLEVQVYINGRLITDPDPGDENVTVSLSYADNGTLSSMDLNFNVTELKFTPSDSVHQGSHVLTVVASKQVLGGQDPVTTHKEQVIILPGGTARITVNFEDADYMTRNDTDLNGNGIPDRLEDMDGDGIPDDMDNDRDGDGVPNAIDLDPDDPLIGGGGGGQVAPVVTSVTPSFGRQGETLDLTIDGSYFQNGATVTVSGTGVTVNTVTFNSASQLVANVTIGGAAPTGLRNVTVDNPDASSGTGLNKFEVVTPTGNPAPIISQVTPNSAQQGETSLQVSIQGQNFLTSPTVLFSNGGITPGTPQFINSTEVRVTIDVDENSSSGEGTVRLTNTDGQWDEAPFTVTAVVPNIAQINPNNANSNQQNVWVTITGNNFLSGINASSSGSPLTIDQVNWISSTEVQVRIDCGFSLFGADRQIILTNPGGGTDQATFHVNGIFE